MHIPHPSERKEISPSVAWRALKNLVERFKLTEEEACLLLGEMPRSTYYKGLKHHEVKLTRDQLERISYLLGIYKALHILFTDSVQGLSWIDRPNALTPFNGITPREYML